MNLFLYGLSMLVFAEPSQAKSQVKNNAQKSVCLMSADSKFQSSRKAFFLKQAGEGCRLVQGLFFIHNNKVETPLGVLESKGDVLVEIRGALDQVRILSLNDKSKFIFKNRRHVEVPAGYEMQYKLDLITREVKYSVPAELQVKEVIMAMANVSLFKNSSEMKDYIRGLKQFWKYERYPASELYKQVYQGHIDHQKAVEQKKRSIAAESQRQKQRQRDLLRYSAFDK